MNYNNKSLWKRPIEIQDNGNPTQWISPNQTVYSQNAPPFFQNGLNPQIYSKKRRKGDNQIQPSSKKQRFHWDGSLHLQFLKQLFKFGLDNIPVRKVFDTLRQYSNDITYDFVEKTLNSLRENMENTLNSFTLYYNQSLHYQESYAGADTVIGKFSLYPFAPQSVKQLYEECQQLHDSQESKGEEDISNTSAIDFSHPLLASGNLNRIAVPKSIFTNPSSSFDSIDSSHSQRETAMDSQIQLHQDMLFQNRYILTRSINQPPTQGVMSFGDVFRKTESGDVVITSSEDDVERSRKDQKIPMDSEHDTTGYNLSLITDVLSAQNDRLVEHVDRYLAEYPSSSQFVFNDPDAFLQNDDDSLPLLPLDPMYNNENDVFDFLK